MRHTKGRLAILAAIVAMTVSGCRDELPQGPVLELADPDVPSFLRVEASAVVLSPGERIGLDRGGAALVSGWGLPAVEAGPVGVWAESVEARVRFRLMDAAPRKLELELSPAPMPPGTAQTLSLELAGIPLTPTPLQLDPGLRHISLPLPNAATRAGSPELLLRFGRAARPMDVLAGSTDPRTLAARVHRIELAREDGVRPATPAMVRGTDPARRTLVMSPPSELTVPLLVSSEAVLELETSAGDTGPEPAIEVAVERDGVPPETLWSSGDLGRSPSRHRVKITPAGEAMTLLVIRALGAPGSTLRLLEPRVHLSAQAEPAEPRTRPAPAPTRPRAIVVLVLDAAAASRLSAYGCPRTTTPEIDGLAARGVLFERAYAPSSYTIASIPAILTGLWPETSGVITARTSLGKGVPTIATWFGARGWKTCAIVSNPHAGRGYGALDGFEVVHELFREVPANSPKRGATPDLSPGRILTLAFAFLHAEPSRPAFLFVHMMPPHYPYLAPLPFRNLFRTPGFEDTAGCWTRIGPRITDGPTQLTTEERLFARDRYDENLRYADGSVGQLLRGLASEGLLDDTLLVVTSDHGEAFGEHGDMFHNTTVYDEMVRVPLVLHLPRTWAPRQRRLETPISTIDLYPTLASLSLVAGERVARPACNGLDLSASVLNGNEPPARPLTSRSIESWGRHALIVDGWKYVRDGKDREDELYDLRADPGEMHNLAERLPVRTAWSSAALTRMLSRRLRLGTPPAGSRTPENGEREILRSLGYVDD